MLLKLGVAPQLMSMFVHFPCTAVLQVWALGYSSLGKGDMYPGMIWGLSFQLSLSFPLFWCWVSPPSLVYLSSSKACRCSPAAKDWPAHETQQCEHHDHTIKQSISMAKSLADINQKKRCKSQRSDLYQQRVMVFPFGEINLVRKHLICCLWIAMLSRNGCLSWIHSGWWHSEHCLDWRLAKSASPQNTSVPTALIAYHCSHLKAVLHLEGLEMENLFPLLVALLQSQDNPS